MRFLTVLALAAMLAACNAGATTPSENPLPTLGGSAGATASADSSAAAMSCDDAFAGIDVADIVGMGTLDSLTDELDATIASCGTVDDWVAMAQTALPTFDLADAETFLAARCADSATLATTPICTELGS